MLIKLFRAWPILLFPFIINAQQNIKGTVLDKQSEIPLIGATVQLLEAEVERGTTTDLDGNFALEQVPLGRQKILVSYLGYESAVIPNIELTAGKEMILEILLEESIENLQEVVVKAEVVKDKAQNELATISARTFSIDDVNRYAGEEVMSGGWLPILRGCLLRMIPEMIS